MITPRVNRLEQASNDMKIFSLLARLVWRSPKKEKNDRDDMHPEQRAIWAPTLIGQITEKAKYRKIPERPSKTREAGETDARFFRVWEKQIRQRYGVTSPYKGLRIGQTEQAGGNFTAKIKHRSAGVVGLNVAVLGLCPIVSQDRFRRRV